MSKREGEEEGLQYERGEREGQYQCASYEDLYSVVVVVVVVIVVCFNRLRCHSLNNRILQLQSENSQLKQDYQQTQDVS